MYKNMGYNYFMVYWWLHRGALDVHPIGLSLGGFVHSIVYLWGHYGSPAYLCLVFLDGGVADPMVFAGLPGHRATMFAIYYYTLTLQNSIQVYNNGVLNP